MVSAAEQKNPFVSTSPDFKPIPGLKKILDYKALLELLKHLGKCGVGAEKAAKRGIAEQLQVSYETACDRLSRI